ncbi:MAG: DUF2784 domain-containing protein [Bacteroidetes bacterium]|nr:DUF2784 domain-containing protein [Bacteroidota bacterium]
MLSIIDIAFLVFHTALIIFNVFGWMWRRTRLANLITLLLTGGSWFILGIFYGWGFCPLTEWHFQVLDKLGERNIPDSYISYLLERLTSIPFDQQSVDMATLGVFLVSLICSVFVNIWYRRRKAQSTG